MDRTSAAAVLGVRTEATNDETRVAFRRLMRVVHPDYGGSDEAASEVLRAYEVMCTAPPVTVEREVPPVVRDLSLAFSGPHEDVFVGLIDRLYRIGIVSYVDAENGLLEAVIDDTHRLTATLQGRATHIEVLFTLDSPHSAGAPDLAALIGQLTDEH